MWDKQPPVFAIEMPFGRLLTEAMANGLGLAVSSNTSRQSWSNELLAKKSDDLLRDQKNPGFIKSFSADAVKQWKRGYSVPGDTLDTLVYILTLHERFHLSWRIALKRAAKEDAPVERSVRIQKNKEYKKPEFGSFAYEINQEALAEEYVDPRESPELKLQREIELKDFPELLGIWENALSKSEVGDYQNAVELLRELSAKAEKIGIDFVEQKIEIARIQAGASLELGRVLALSLDHQGAMQAYQDATVILRPINEKQCLASEVLFWQQATLAAVQCRSLPEARGLLDQGTSSFFRPTASFYRALMSNARTEDDVEKLYAEMVSAGVTPDTKLLTQALRKVSRPQLFNFLTGEAERLNLPTDDHFLLSIILASPQFDQAEHHFAEYEKTNTANQYCYAAIIQKSPNFEKASEYFHQAVANLDQVGTFLFNALLDRCQSAEQMDPILQEMHAQRLAPDGFTFGCRLRHAESDDDIKELIAEMITAEIPLERFHLGFLVRLSSDFDDACSTVESNSRTLKSKDPYLINVLLNRADGMAQVERALKLLKAGQFDADQHTMSTAISKVGDLAEAQKVFQELTDVGVVPNAICYNALISKCKDYDSALEIISQMKVAGVKPTQSTYNFLFRFSDELSGSVDLVEELKAAGLKQNNRTFNTRIARSESYEEARSIFDEMVDEEVMVDVVTFNSLISKAREYSTATEILEEMDDLRIKPSPVTFNAMFASSQSEADRNEIFALMNKYGIRPNDRTLQSATASSADFAEADRHREFLAKYYDVVGNSHTYHALARRCSTEEECLQILARAKESKLKISFHFFGELIKKLNDFAHTKEILEIMNQREVIGNSNIFDFCFATATNLKDKFFLARMSEDHGNEPGKQRLASMLLHVENLDDAELVMELYKHFRKHSTYAEAETLKVLSKNYSFSELLPWAGRNGSLNYGSLGRLVGHLISADKVQEVLEAVLKLPFLSELEGFYRSNEDDVVEYLTDVVEDDARACGAAYALGLCFHANSKKAEAIKWFEFALYHPDMTHPKRVSEIEKRLSSLKMT